MQVKWFDRFLKNPEDVSCDCGETEKVSTRKKKKAPSTGPSCCGSGPAEEGEQTFSVKCCGPSVKDKGGSSLEQVASRLKTGEIITPAGRIPKVSANLLLFDRMGSWKARWGIGRISYKVPPGLYALGNPEARSPVFVSANYKMSFDRLRSSLPGVDGWILVLDTRGINVWCAAGKGSFGTDELVSRIESTGLSLIVAHKNLILPQLGAPGIAAHVIKKRSGFSVVYGPVRASDLPAFLEAGNQADPEMRRVRFPLKDRAVLAPVELVGVLRHPVALSLLAVWIISLLAARFLTFDFPALFGAVVVGAVVTPLLLPWIPFRTFAAKGWILGFLWAAAAFALHSRLEIFSHSWLEGISYLLVLPAVSAFLAMNFTGSSTVTSLSGVVKEMRTALPLILCSLLLGFATAITGLFLK